MFKKFKENEIDIVSLNQILKTGKKIINIGYFMAIIALILLGTYLIKEWKILYYIKDIIIVMSPVFIGLLIAWLFEPLVTKLEKKKVPKILGCIIIYLLILSILFIILYLFVPSLISQLRDFVNATPEIFENLTNTTIDIIKKFDINNVSVFEKITEEITHTLTNYSKNMGSRIPGYIFTVGKNVISGSFNIILGLMIGFYLLYDFNKVKKYIKSIIPVDWRDSYQELMNRVNTSLRSYVQGILLVMLLVFVTQSIGLTLAGMKAPILFALFCAVTDIIPYVGPYIGGIPAVIVGFTISPITGICVIISILVVQLLENNFYQPLIMGHTMELHPVTIIIGLLLFQHFFGIIGMVIATPVIACLKVFFIFFNEKYQFINKITGENIIEEKKDKNNI